MKQNRGLRRLAALLLVLLPVACVAPAPPSNQFEGAWNASDNVKLVFRNDTVVVNQPNGTTNAYGAATCDGKFRFGYGDRSRDLLLGLVSRQSDIRAKLSSMLVQPSYPIAVLICGDGDHTYVMLDDHDVVTIYREGDIANLDRLTRT
jgi:hypothetical protein